MTTDLDDLMTNRTDEPEDTTVRRVDGSITSGPDEAADDGGDDLFENDLLLAPARTSRVTIVLAALLILVVGFLLGVEVQQVFGAPVTGASAAATSSKPASSGS